MKGINPRSGGPDRDRRYKEKVNPKPGKRGREQESALGIAGPKRDPGPQMISKRVWKGGNMLYPLPAVMVSCARAGEKPNIITIAWAGTVCTDPAMVSISVRPSRYSYDIIDETKEFVINLVPRKLVRACDFCGVRSGRDTDKFKMTGLQAIHASSLSLAPLIAESPVNIECRVVEKLTPGSHHIFLARVTAVDVDESLIEKGGRLDLGRAGLISYSHGEYFGQGELLGSFGYSVKKKKNRNHLN